MIPEIEEFVGYVSPVTFTLGGNLGSGTLGGRNDDTSLFRTLYFFKYILRNTWNDMDADVDVLRDFGEFKDQDQ